MFRLPDRQGALTSRDSYRVHGSRIHAAGPNRSAPVGIRQMYGPGVLATRDGVLACAIMALSVLPILALTALLALAGPARGGPDFDLTADARRVRAEGTPIVVLFSAEHCSYCELVKREYIEPLLGDPVYRDKLIVRVVEGTQPRLVDFSGREVSHARFASDQGVSFFPTIRFFGANGVPVAEDIVGVGILDFYGAYLQIGIDSARLAVGDADTRAR